MGSLTTRKLKRRLGPYAPGACAVLLLLVSVAPFRLGLLNQASLAALAACIYYWGLFRPAQMPYGFVFILGLLFDVMSGLPPGLSSFSWLILRGMVGAYGRLFAASAFGGVWAGFALTFGLCTLLNWLMLSWYYSHWLPAARPALFWLLAAVFYPLPHLLFTALYKNLETERRGLGRR